MRWGTNDHDRGEGGLMASIDSRALAALINSKGVETSVSIRRGTVKTADRVSGLYTVTISGVDVTGIRAYNHCLVNVNDYVDVRLVGETPTIIGVLGRARATDMSTFVQVGTATTQNIGTNVVTRMTGPWGLTGNASLWDTNNSLYVVPTTGIYQGSLNIRVNDTNNGAPIRCSMNISDSWNETPSFFADHWGSLNLNWCDTFNAGDAIRILVHCATGTIVLLNRKLTIWKVGEL